MWAPKACDLHWRSKIHEVGYRMLMFSFLFIVPFAIILVCFKKMQSRLKKNSSFATTSMDAFSAQRRVHQNKRLVRMLFSVVLCFLVCCLPLNILLLLFCFYKEIFNWSPIGILGQMCFILLLCQSIANPGILFVMGKDIRKAIPFCATKVIEKNNDKKSAFFLKSQGDTTDVTSPNPIQKEKLSTQCLLSDLPHTDEMAKQIMHMKFEVFELEASDA